MQTENISLPERDNDLERIIGIVFDLPPQQAAIVYGLSKGAVATPKQLMDFLGTNTHPKIAINHIRTRFKDEGLSITSRWNVGYWMDEDTRQKIDTRIREFLEGR